MEHPLNSKVEIEFIKGDFTSPLVGNVYIGKRATLNASTANRLIETGVAKLVQAEDGEEKKSTKVNRPAADATEAEENGNSGDAGNADADVEKLSLADALATLKHEDPAHWTKGGLPDLNVLKELTGVQVTRADIEKEAPKFVRVLPAT